MSIPTRCKDGFFRFWDCGKPPEVIGNEEKELELEKEKELEKEWE